MTTTLRIPRTSARLVGLVASCCAVVSVVAACSGGGGSTSTTVAAGAASTAQPTSGAAGGGFGAGGGGGLRGIDPAELQKIQDCLTAAGITIPTGRPSFSNRPSNLPTDGSFPTDGNFPTDRVRPSGFPSGGPGGGFGGLGRVLNDPAAKAALDACGLTLPSFSPRVRRSGGGAASPSAS